jgi:acyl carrier protein
MGTPPDDETIERMVFEVLKERWSPPILDSLKERFLGKPHRELKKTAKLVGDVWGDGDDATYFIEAVEKRIGVPIPIGEWKQVFTIQDVIDLFKRHRDRPAS